MDDAGEGREKAMREAAFMGAVTASITHEVQNVLAIIQQSAGLMGDLLDLSRRETLKSLGFRKGFQYHDKFSTLIAAINDQVKRGSDLSDGLNRLAHVPDTAADVTDLARAAGLLFSLIGRIARKRRVEFVLDAVDGTHMSACQPMQALMSLYGAARALIDALSGCAVHVAVAALEGGPAVDFILPEGGGGAASIVLPETPGGGEGAGRPTVAVLADRIRLVFPPCDAQAAGR
jgi:signal transduction histidine kinase